ncbi:uncharacterized protein LOC128292704 [Gossypium arboreum]|uniref:uncharacterized protein LOC128292704 n=1 Tax=Gossypium arboreum TaxID=29729 RepID=UPI0022F174A3|nr:uncharacterized protein LOC128292704 [Gossypium arboreum]
MSAHFIPVRTDYSLQKLAKLYVSEIVRLHGVQASVISDRDPHFPSWFWKKLHEALGERRVLGLELVSGTEDKVRLIRDQLKAASDKQKSYADLKRREIEYIVGDFVFLKLELPLKLDRIHDVFHVSILRCYCSDSTHIVSIEEIKIRPDLTFKEEPVQILDRDVKVLRRKSILLVKVLWCNHSTKEATWESKDTMRQQYPHLF